MLVDRQLFEIVIEGERTLLQIQQGGSPGSSQMQQYLEQHLREHCVSIWGRLGEYVPTFIPTLLEGDSKAQPRTRIVPLIEYLLEAQGCSVEILGAQEEPLRIRIGKIIDNLRAIFQITDLPTRPVRSSTPRALHDHAFSRRWSPLDVRYLPRGVGNNLEEDLPLPISSFDVQFVAQLLDRVHQTFLKGTPVGEEPGILSLRRLRLLAAMPVVAAESMLLLLAFVALVLGALFPALLLLLLVFLLAGVLLLWGHP